MKEILHKPVNLSFLLDAFEKYYYDNTWIIFLISLKSFLNVQN